MFRLAADPWVTECFPERHGSGEGRWGWDREVNQKGREKGNYVRLFISALSAAA